MLRKESYSLINGLDATARCLEGFKVYRGKRGRWWNYDWDVSGWTSWPAWPIPIRLQDFFQFSSATHNNDRSKALSLTIST